MKYIKLFEDISQDGYKKCSRDEVYAGRSERVSDPLFKEFTKREADILKSLGFHDGYANLAASKSIGKDFSDCLNKIYQAVKPSVISTSSIYKYVDIHISKANDEWYYIMWKNPEVMIPDRDANYNIPTPTLYYKCDQWDGLMACLDREFGVR